MRVTRFLLCCSLCWCSLELWARFRFSAQSLWLPMELRTNFDISPLESRRLKKNFTGSSKKGDPINTDRYGFRCMHQSNRDNEQVDRQPLILAGDSIAFGMYLPFEDSWGYHLQARLKHWKVLVQALPGGSQALTNQHLFGDDNLAKQTKAKWLIHTLTHYDNTDNWLFEADLKKQERWSTRTFRFLQKYCGPYWIQMVKLKIRSFLNKDQRRQLLFAETIERKGATKRSLNQLKNKCLENEISLAIVFTPDRGELLGEGDPGAQVRELCHDLNLPCFDLNMAFREEYNKGALELSHLFRDDQIHFTPNGAQWAGKLLSKWFEIRTR